MDILISLGVKWTLFVHLACFGVAYFFLTTFILKPYLAAYHEREKRTIGGEENALRLIEEANKLQSRYEQSAKALNHEIRAFYDQSRSEAMAKSDKVLAAARNEAAGIVKQTQTEVEREIGKARLALKNEVPAVSAAIATQLAGKEISI